MVSFVSSLRVVDAFAFILLCFRLLIADVSQVALCTSLSLSLCVYYSALFLPRKCYSP